MEVLEATAEPTRPATRAGLRYRPYLDGLRCVAVYLVVAFHAGLHRFSGGFIGVDIFFVLSGFLMTRILVRELVQRDRIRLPHFYARRFRRILPAAAVTLLVSAFVYGIVASPFEGAVAGGDYRASFLYYANWHFISQASNYFAPAVDASPVLHFWSLAVEEQFYLTWPLVLTGLFLIARLARRWQWWALRALMGVAVVASAAWALHLATTNLDRAYYGTDARVYQLVAGGLIAITPQLVTFGRRLLVAAGAVALVALVALVGLGTSAVTMSPITRGIAVVALTAAVIVALERAPRGIAGRVLSERRVAYLGRISYGTYLWHWPIIVVLTRKIDPGGIWFFVLIAVLSTVLAAISFHLLEHPIRVSRALDALDGRVIVTALTFSLIAGILIAPALRAFTGSSPDIARLSVSVPSLQTGDQKLLDWVKASNDIPDAPDCTKRDPNACILVHGKGKRLLLMGDSVARMWIPAFTEIARREGYSLAIAVTPGCPWWVPEDTPDANNDCARQRAYWYEHLVPEYDPDIVFLGHRALDAPGNPFWVTTVRDKPADYRVYVTEHSGAAEGDSAQGEATIRREAEKSLAALRKPGRELVILEPPPVPVDPTFDPLNCVSTGSANCAFSVGTDPTASVRAFQELARTPDTWAIDLNRVVCPRLPVCDPVINDIIVHRDHTHISGTFAGAVAGALQERLRTAGVLPAKR
jgi:peptidoglycan/LPS O-acetylase OafA/YrhL